jgi:REP element-mobilizing transposase RayT
MRTARIVEGGAAYYHVISRVVGRQYAFDGDLERERVRKTLRAVAGFSGVRVVTYACLSNHFHVLVYVPERQGVADEEFGRRLRCLYDRTLVENLLARLAELRAAGQAAAAEALKAPYLSRMHSLAEFVKALKQRVSIGYNRRHGRVGTLWEERYKSVLVDGRPGALMTMAAYIDLNPVPGEVFHRWGDSGEPRIRGGSVRAASGALQSEAAEWGAGVEGGGVG